MHPFLIETLQSTAGKIEWSFESPADWFAGDKSLAYNGTLQVITLKVAKLNTCTGALT